MFKYTLFTDLKIPVIGTPLSNQRRHFQIRRRWGPLLDPMAASGRLKPSTHWLAGHIGGLASV